MAERRQLQQQHSCQTQVREEIGGGTSDKVSVCDDLQLGPISRAELEGLQHKSDAYIAGAIKYYGNAWETITKDDYVLGAIHGLEIPFERPPRWDGRVTCLIDEHERDQVRTEIKSLIEKGVLEQTSHEDGEFISNFFLRPKSTPGKFRLICNLKKLNEFVEYQHFKMETIYDAINMVTDGCYMATVDLKDAYHSVPMAEKHRKFLKIEWEGQLWQYTALPFGLRCGPYNFTRIVKPLLAYLRNSGLKSICYLDDLLLLGGSREECNMNVQETVRLFAETGFVINLEKSVLTPSQRVEFLGFVLDSRVMNVTIPRGKADKIVDMCRELRGVQRPTIKMVARTVGMVVAAFPAASLGPLHYRQLEKDKVAAVRKSRGSFEGRMILSEKSTQELEWWIHNVVKAARPIAPQSASVWVHSDASFSGWGGTAVGLNSPGRREAAGLDSLDSMAVMGVILPKCSTAGEWSKTERDTENINYLELRAVLHVLRALCPTIRGRTVHIQVDNVTAVSAIARMGSKSDLGDTVAMEIWDWAITRENWLEASHIAGEENIEADVASRKKHAQDIEWGVTHKAYNTIVKGLKWTPQVDLFATRLNFKIKPFMSWKPDPEAEGFNAFSIFWGDRVFYAFPPFAIILKVLRKVHRDEATGILIAPLWQAQPWFPVLLEMLMADVFLLPRATTVLHHPTLLGTHPMGNRLKLGAFLISGRQSRRQAYQRERKL